MHIGKWSVALAAALVVPGTASAIDIQLTYDKVASPGYDLEGAILMDHAEEAARRWELLYPYSNATFEIDVNWTWDLDSNILGNMDWTGELEMNASPTWFLDPTPALDEEFGPLKRKQYAELSYAVQDDAFNGSPPNGLEVAAWREATADLGAEGRPDLLTVLMHEIGHWIIGLGGLDQDDTFDIDPAWLGGASVQFETVDDGHNAVSSALMYHSTASGVRLLPCAIEALAGAEENGGFGGIDLDRIDFIGSGAWGTSNNWVAGRVPDPFDSAWVEAKGLVTLGGAHPALSRLEISEKSPGLIAETPTTVQVDEKIVVNSLVLLPGGTLEVPEGGLAHVVDLNLSGGTLKLSGGDATLEGVAGSGRIAGCGHVFVPIVFDGPVTLQSEPAAGCSALEIELFSLQLPLEGQVRAIDGDIVINDAGVSSIGIVEVAGPNVLTVSVGIAMLPSGHLVLDGTSGTPRVSTGSVDAAACTVSVSGTGVIDARLFTDYTWFHIEEKGRLELWGDTTWSDESHVFGSDLAQIGDSEVVGYTFMDVETLDLDGYGSTTTSVRPGTLLEVYAARAWDEGDPGFGGALLIDGGTVKMDLDEGAFAVVGGSVTLQDNAAFLATFWGDMSLESATLAGHGVVLGDLVSAGTIIPAGASGNAVGTLNVNEGDYTQLETGELQIQIASSGADRLLVQGGNATLDGTLVLTFAGGPSLVPGTTYTVLQADKVYGTFSQVLVPLGYGFAITYLSDRVLVAVTDAP